MQDDPRQVCDRPLFWRFFAWHACLIAIHAIALVAGVQLGPRVCTILLLVSVLITLRELLIPRASFGLNRLHTLVVGVQAAITILVVGWAGLRLPQFRFSIALGAGGVVALLATITWVGQELWGWSHRKLELDR